MTQVCYNGGMIIEIPDKLPTNNLFYAGTSYHKRIEIKRKWAILTLAALPLEYTMFTKPVHITVYLESKRTPQDCDNVTPKCVIDTLKGKVLYDDNPKWVSGVTYYSRKSDRDHTTLVIEEAEARLFPEG